MHPRQSALSPPGPELTRGDFSRRIDYGVKLFLATIAPLTKEHRGTMIARLTRLVLATLLAALLPAPPADGQSAAPPTPSVSRTVTILLNSGLSGANSWLLLAESRGYFRAEGLEVRFTTGTAPYMTAERIEPESFDFGYGDINALIEQAAIHPETAPVGVFMVFNRSPSAIVLPRASPITTPAQLVGKRIIGHASDVALNTFDAYAARARIDPSKVMIVRDSSDWPTLMTRLREGRADAVFGDISTSMAVVEAAGGDAEGTLRFLRYSDAAPELYGSALMASRAMVRSEPGVVRAFVRAANRGLVATVSDPDAAIAELVRRTPELRPEVERNRLLRTLHGDMGSPEGKKLGIGDVEPKRLSQAIQLMRETSRLPRLPRADEVFSRAFLPPLSDRITTLAHERR